MSDPAGRLNIQLQRTPRGLTSRIDSTRPVTAASMFRGRTPADTAALLPRLYSICARAQSQACVTALELATHQPPAPTVSSLRRQLVAAETIREHLWRVLLDWPRILGTTPNRDAMSGTIRLTKALFDTLDPANELFRLGAQHGESDRDASALLLMELDALLASHVFGTPSARWLETHDDGQRFIRWIERTETCAARLMRDLHTSGTAILGQSAVTALPDIRDAELAARMHAEDTARFLAQPTWGGLTRETSPFTRRAGTRLIRDLITSHGPGILTRMAAQLLEIAMLLEDIRGGLADPRPSAPERRTLQAGLGIGRAEAARGRLFHLARVEQEEVTHYHILAPTEWNFHPHGVVATGIAALADADDQALRRQTELLIMATDPCVAYDLTISNVSASTQR